MSFKTVKTTLASDVASAGTFDVSYPDGTDAGHFGGYKHKMYVQQADFSAPDDFTVSFGASNITVTYNGSTTLEAGAEVWLQFDQIGDDEGDPKVVTAKRTHDLGGVLRVEFGKGDTADADGVCQSQAGTQDTAMTINGALASGGVATFDVPRNVVAAWTTSAKLTITGTDEYGNTIVETTASAGTSHTGKKAFKTVTSVVPDTNITGATVGTGDVLGLPFFLPGTGYVLQELEDGAAPTAGTFVAGVTSAATATTGDVRGTWDPNTALDGAKDFDLLVAGVDPENFGVDQYGG